MNVLTDRGAQFVMAATENDYDEAIIRLERAALTLDCSPNPDAAHQAALLAAATCAIRMFRGGVFMTPNVTGQLTIGQERPQTIRRRLETLGVRTINPPDHAVRLRVGACDTNVDADLHATCSGWIAKVDPRACLHPTAPSNVLTGVAAGGLAIAELFRKAVLDDVLACKRSQQMDVWGNAGHSDPEIRRLPQALWFVGLGNLGQASLFTLALLPWRDPALTTLLLNDADVCGVENLAVQVLTSHSSIGQPKARAAAAWAEARGFRTIVSERRFSAATKPQQGEPRIALVGVDNLAARRCVAEAGFDLVVDAGLGATGAEAFDIRLHVFPGTQTAASVWPEQSKSEAAALGAAYQRLIAQGRLDACGAMTIADHAVGVPCTAIVAAALQIAQMCRALASGHCLDRIDLSLADLRHAAVRPMPAHLPATPPSFSATD
ncbi:MAG: ThiF family adenylyltransferase [Hyphomicrobiales bacterium]|mgnify:CR=1 FL=1|nr:ThiF family adenylyltransferase [Hyphomicrobiales bacterium]MCC2106712.1 ThiF family adenylyltransferase [Hyphomicrobiales bacterium]